MTIDYRDVAKVRSGYGRVNMFTGRHTSQTSLWVGPVIVMAVVGLCFVPVLLSKD
jgi:hypothetical protein